MLMMIVYKKKTLIKIKYKLVKLCNRTICVLNKKTKEINRIIALNSTDDYFIGVFFEVIVIQ